jgi:surface polysaccharide O-acyltransferase-like enzyme
MAFLATFLRFLNSHHRTLDSPTRNSYGIFLTHFIFVSWLGYALVPSELPALAKFTLVVAGALALSSIATRLLLHIPHADRVL